MGHRIEMEMADFLDVRPWALMWGAKGTRETKKNSVLTIHGYQKKGENEFCAVPRKLARCRSDQPPKLGLIFI